MTLVSPLGPGAPRRLVLLFFLGRTEKRNHSGNPPSTYQARTGSFPGDGATEYARYLRENLSAAAIRIGARGAKAPNHHSAGKYTEKRNREPAERFQFQARQALGPLKPRSGPLQSRDWGLCRLRDGSRIAGVNQPTSSWAPGHTRTSYVVLCLQDLEEQKRPHSPGHTPGHTHLHQHHQSITSQQAATRPGRH